MKILVAIDGSKASLNSAKYAAKLASSLRTKNSITLVSVHDDVALKHAAKYIGKAQINDYLREISEKELKSAQKVLDKAGVKHDMAIRVGHIADEIIKFSTSGKFDLIVMGSKGRSGFADLLLGSIAQRVSSYAKQPVVLVK